MWCTCSSKYCSLPPPSPTEPSRLRLSTAQDWGATGRGSLAATQDMEMPGGGTFNRTLRAQILAGQVTAVRHHPPHHVTG